MKRRLPNTTWYLPPCPRVTAKGCSKGSVFRCTAKSQTPCTVSVTSAGRQFHAEGTGVAADLVQTACQHVLGRSADLAPSPNRLEGLDKMVMVPRLIYQVRWLSGSGTILARASFSSRTFLRAY